MPPHPPILETPAPPAGGGLSARQMAWPVLLSVAVVAVVVGVTYEPDTLRLMAGINWGVLALAFGMVGLRVLLGGLRLSYISHGHVSLLGGMRGAVAWDFMSAVTPSAIGGAPIASYYVAKDNGLPLGEATAIMLFSMLSDQVWFALSIPVILFATTQIDVFPPEVGAVGAGTLTVYFLFMMGWAVFFAYATVIRPSILESVATWVVRFRWLRRFEDRVREEFVSLRERAEVLRGGSPRFFVTAFGLASGIWMARYLTVLLVALSVVPDLDAVTTLFRAAGMMLTTMVVPTPGGSGGVEGLYVLWLGSVMPKELLGPTLLTWRMLAYYLFIAAGLVLTARMAQRRLFTGSPDVSGDGRNGAAPDGVGDAPPPDAPPPDAPPPDAPTDAEHPDPPGPPTP